MKKSIFNILCGICVILMAGCNPTEPTYSVTTLSPVAVSKSNSMKVYVHYMPWFENKASNGGTWGVHWKMSKCNPDSMDANGRRQIASHYYPLVGPYASSDPDLIEYHLLLMKYAGIDGILIDWYGSYNINDTYKLTRNSNAIIEACKKVGLEFAIIYEDRTIPNVMINTGSKDTVELAVTDMAYIMNSYMTRSNYIKVNNAPLLGVFGPDFINKPSQWTSLLGIYPTKPYFMIPYGRDVPGNNYNYFYPKVGASNVSAVFMWPWGAWGPWGATDDKNDHGLDITHSRAIYDDLAAKNIPAFAGAWPGFHSYYYQGDGKDSLFFVDYRKGELWNDMLAEAKKRNMPQIQLITWNDFGEGTMIEPTQEFGYSFLTSLQTAFGVSTNQTQLETIYQMYLDRKKYKLDSYKQAQLNQAFYYMVSMQNQKATNLLTEIEN